MGQADPGSGADGPFSRPLQAVQLRGVDRQHVQSLVRRQQVGPAAQGQQGPAPFRLHESFILVKISEIELLTA